MAKITMIEWTEIVNYGAYVTVPDDFDLDTYDATDALAEINTDSHHLGTERQVDEYKFVLPMMVPGYEDVEEIDWEGHRQ